MASAVNDSTDSWDEDETESTACPASKPKEEDLAGKQATTTTTSNPYDSWDDDEDEIASKTTVKKQSNPAIKDSKDDDSCLNQATVKSDNSKYLAQPEDETMIVKPSCSCTSCTHWTESNDWTTTNDLEFEGYHKKTCAKVKKAQPFLRSEKHAGKTPKISAFQTDHLTKIEKQTMFKTLVHGEIIPKPVTNFTDTYFTEDIQKSLADLNYKYSLPLQSFAWPAIFRQLNVFMIGDHKSGKTMAYLPAIATFGLGQEEKYQELAKHNGPLAIIICTSSKQCEEVLDLLKKLHEKIHTKPKISIVTYPTHILKGTDILITIPDSLKHCLQSRMFNLKRLCHLVLEDASNLLYYFENSVYQILGLIEDMLKNRINSTRVQLIATSMKWSGQLEKLYRSIYLTPLICIENYLEAALYGSIRMDVKVLQAKDKKEYLKGILQNKSNFYKTVVFCQDSEVSDLSKYLQGNRIKTIALSDNSTKEEIEEGEFEWACEKASQYKVLVCTDFIFETSLCINDANWLIHYSFSSTWTRFTKRFNALSSFYKSPWDQNKSATPCHSFLIIDDTCEQQMPKIINLIKRLNNNLPAGFKQLHDEYRIRSENEKLSHSVELCQKLKLFGKCPDTFCENRHVVSEEVDVSKELPNKGKVMFKILNMKDVTHYTVQLVAQIDENGVVLKINEDDLKKPLTYGSEAKKRVKNIKIGKFYAHCDHTTEGDVYTLCHVLSINNTNVEVKLTTGLSLQTMKSKLFEVPSYLQIVDVIFCNLLPPFKDANFSGRSFFVTRTKLEQLEYKSLTLTGDIHLQLDGTLWLDNVVQAVRVEGMNVIKLHLTKKLLDLQVVEKSITQINNLHKLCTKCNIILPTYVKKVVRKPKTQDVEPQRAFLDDNINEVYFVSAVSPDEFYVRLAKFSTLLLNLEDEIQNALKTEIPHKIRSLEIGKYYLALDPGSQIYSRVKVLNVEKNRALCFYVDYGDEGVVDISDLRILPTKYLTKLPFQAIQCRLYGLCPAVEKWDAQATDILYKYLLEPDSDILRSLYVEVRAKDDGDTVRAKTKYSVLLKDGYGDKNVLINQLLLECGLATSIFQKIDDFEIPQPEVVEQSSDFDSSDENVAPELEEGDDNMEDEGIGEQFDCEIFNTGEFLEMIGMEHLSRLNVPQLTYEPSKENSVPENVLHENATPDKSIEENPNYLTPEVYWSQTDETVKMKIRLIGVTKYKANLIQKRIFTFSTHLEDKHYQLKFTLHKLAELGKHCAHGQEVVVVLKKMERLEWLQLTGAKKRMRNIHYEIKIEGEKPKKFLDLGISDTESEDDVMYHEISDMDSEYDQEVYSSSSD